MYHICGGTSALNSLQKTLTIIEVVEFIYSTEPPLKWNNMKQHWMKWKWNEMKWQERKWNKMKWNEKIWNETYEIISIKHFQILKINNFLRRYTISEDLTNYIIILYTHLQKVIINFLLFLSQGKWQCIISVCPHLRENKKPRAHSFISAINCCKLRSQMLLLVEKQVLSFFLALLVLTWIAL